MKPFKEEFRESEKNILKLRLIGRVCEVEYSSHLFKGEIIEETKNIWRIQTQTGIKALPKSESKIRIKINNQIYQINGNQLIGRQEDRIKRRMKRKW